MIDVTVYGCELDEAALFREKAPYFGITPTITAAPLSEENVRVSAGARCISIGHKTRIPNSLLDALSESGVRYVSTRSIGSDHLDVAYATTVGLTVEGVAYSPDSVADHTVMVMLMALRHVKAGLRRIDVHDYRLHATRGRELRDLTVGVVGTGRIGSAVVERLRGFGCRILTFDVRQSAGAEIDFDELLRQSDIVTLHVPLDPTTHHLLDRERIAAMRPGAVVVNTGRGALLDTGALVEALESGTLGGVALDVLEGEDGIFYADHRMRPPEHAALRRLQELPNAIVTPHTAFYTDHALNDTVVNSLTNCLRFEKGLRHD